MNLTTNAKLRYSAGAMIFHWTIAVLVIWNWRLAENAEHAETREQAMAIFADHKAIGITILALTLGRIAWRLTHRMPALPATYAKWEWMLARGTHIVFYVLLVALPLGGWYANSLAGREVDMFGLFTIPPLPVGDNPDLAGSIFDLHGTGAMAMIYLVGLHILGALKHTFVDRDGGIFRMLPFGRVDSPR
ncbi:cytochrome b [Qipengyuania sp. MTN3-11]